MDIENAGGTRGGLGTFLVGASLALVSAWFFVDSVRVTSGGYGWVSRGLGGNTGSAAVVFMPLFIAIIALFYDATKKWAWGLLGVGAFIIAVEIVSRLSFWFNLKLSHFMIMLIGLAAGIGLMIRSFKALPPG